MESKSQITTFIVTAHERGAKCQTRVLCMLSDVIKIILLFLLFL